MKDILEEIIAWKKIEVEQFKSQLSSKQLYAMTEKKIEEDNSTNKKLLSFGKSLLESKSGIIAEFKRKSPSKNWINENAKANVVPLSYQENGAAALSILTDEKYFGGSNEFIKTAINSGVNIPILYKNFIIDEYQLFQARFFGASAVLLIAANLSIAEYKQLLATAHELGLEVLLEMHKEKELDYAELEPDVYGINNRNLGTFVTDVQNSFNLASQLPKEAIKVSESGISNPNIVRELKIAGFNGFLIGENFMKTNNPGESLKNFILQL